MQYASKFIILRGYRGKYAICFFDLEGMDAPGLWNQRLTYIHNRQ